MIIELKRRGFLKALGLGAGLVPLLNQTGRAADETPPKRFIVINIPNGYMDGSFLPSGGETDWVIPTADDSPLKPLIPFRDKLIVMGGISLKNGQDTNDGLGGHAALPFLLTGARGSPGPTISDGVEFSAGHASVDRYIARHLPGNDANAFDSLVVRACRFYNNDSFLSFDGACLDGVTPNAPAPMDDPIAMYDALFGSFQDPSIDAAALLRERKSVLDLSRRQLGRLQRYVSASDKQRIDQHLEGIRQLEKQLGGIGSACSKPERLGTPAEDDYVREPANPNLPAIVKAQIDMIVSAMACGMTQVASLALSNSNNNSYTFYWLKDKNPAFGEAIGDLDSGGFNGPGMLWHHHAISHNEGSLGNMKNYVDQWFLSQLAYLLEQLEARTDATGTPMLDNTLVLFTNTQATGGGHQTDDIKWIMAGNLDGYFKTGRYLRHVGGSDGVPQNGILTAVVNAMGCPPIDYFGEADYGGELTVLRG